MIDNGQDIIIMIDSAHDLIMIVYTTALLKHVLTALSNSFHLLNILFKWKYEQFNFIDTQK